MEFSASVQQQNTLDKSILILVRCCVCNKYCYHGNRSTNVDSRIDSHISRPVLFLFHKQVHGNWHLQRCTNCICIEFDMQLYIHFIACSIGIGQYRKDAVHDDHYHVLYNGHGSDIIFVKGGKST